MSSWTGRILAAACSIGVGLPALAEEKKAPPPFPHFETKRIGVPKAGEKRIRVQIGPQETITPVVTPTPSAAPNAARYAWFWEDMSPALAATGPGRLDEALRVLEKQSGRVAAPRLQDMQDLAAAHGADILRATVGTEVSPALVLAVMMIESGGRADAISRAGAQGLMQLIPDTADRFGVVNAMAPKDNITGGVKYLNWLMGHFDRDPVLVLAGYNAGEGAVRDHAGVPPYPETRDYVPKVLAAYSIARGLCLTPPELITDGCVFAVMR